MYKGKKILGLIPARGSSKGLPGKNIRPIAGKPLIAWSVEQALKSKYLDRVIVSTDDEKIADVARGCGAEVPFIRPPRLASDTAKAVDVVIHAIDWFNDRSEFYDLAMLLQPTSPLRISEDIDNAITMLFSEKAKAVVSVCEAEHSPLWTNVLPNDGSMRDFLKPEALNRNRQELPLYYRINGAVYLAYSDYLKSGRSFYGSDAYAYIMPAERSVDIDSRIDLDFAEFLFSKRQPSCQKISE